jgi:hypothetical protein
LVFISSTNLTYRSCACSCEMPSSTIFCHARFFALPYRRIGIRSVVCAIYSFPREREGRKIRKGPGSRDSHTFRSNVPGFSALLISSPVATLYSPIRTHEHGEKSAASSLT